MRTLQSATAGFGQFSYRYDNGELIELLTVWRETGQQAATLLIALTLLVMDMRKILSPLVWLVDNTPLVIEATLDACQIFYETVESLFVMQPAYRT